MQFCIGVSAESAFCLCLPDTYCSFSFLDTGGENLSVLASVAQRPICSQWGCDTVSRRFSVYSGIYLLPKASQVTCIYQNHPPVTFDTYHMMRLKLLLVALRLNFFSAIPTPSQEVTHPSKAYVELVKVRVLFMWTFNGPRSLSAAAQVRGWLRLDIFLGRKPQRVSLRKCPRRPEHIAGPDVSVCKHSLNLSEQLLAQCDDQGQNKGIDAVEFVTIAESPDTI